MSDGARNFVVTPNDHGGVVVIVSLLLMTWTILCLLIRVYTRMNTKVSIGVDDLLCLVGTVFAIIETIVANVSVTHGFGKALVLISPRAIPTIEKYQYAVTLLSLVTIVISKCTMICFHFRITPNKTHRLGAWVILAVTGAVGIAWVCVEGARCGGGHPWAVLERKCPDYNAGWIAIAATDVVTEIAIFLMPIWIVHDLQMSIRTKAIVVSAFALRLPVIAASLTHLHYTTNFLSLPRPFVEAVTPYTCLQVEVHFGLMTTTFPTLGPFMKSLNTRWGTIDPLEARSYAMDSLTDGKDATQRSLAGTGYAFKVKSDANNGMGMAGSRGGGLGGGKGGMKPRSVGSGDSERMIIHHTTETMVQYDE